MEHKSSYELDNRLYRVNNRFCKVYLPPLYIDGIKYYWVQYQDNLDVSVVEDKNLKLLNKTERLLYGSK